MLGVGWSKEIVAFWFIFIGVFLGTDLMAWLTRDPRIPTFSRVVVHYLPWWISLPAVILLLVHWASMYWKL